MLKKIHYIYKITNINPVDERKYYIGVRSTTKETPKLDNKYMGSCKSLNAEIKKRGKEQYKKEILSTWETRELAMAEEIRLHEKYNVSKNRSFYNESNATSKKFSTEGYVTVKDSRDNQIKNIRQEDYVRGSFYTPNAKGTVVVLDIRTNEKKRVSKEEYEKNEYYSSINKGCVIVLNKSNETIRITVEEYNLNRNLYKIHTTGKVPIIDTRDGSKKMVTIEEFKNKEHYVTALKNKVLVLDLKDNKKKMVLKHEVESSQDRYLNVHENMMTVIDTRDMTKKRVRKEDYHKFEYYINTRSKKIEIYNSKDELQYTTLGNFEKTCMEKGLPHQALKKSVKKNGEPIYEDMKNRYITIVKNKGYYKYKGWYAKVSK